MSCLLQASCYRHRLTVTDLLWDTEPGHSRHPCLSLHLLRSSSGQRQLQLTCYLPKKNGIKTATGCHGAVSIKHSSPYKVFLSESDEKQKGCMGSASSLFQAIDSLMEYGPSWCCRPFNKSSCLVTPQPYNYFITLPLPLLVTKSRVKNSDPGYLILDPWRGLGENLCSGCFYNSGNSGKRP